MVGILSPGDGGEEVSLSLNKNTSWEICPDSHWDHSRAAKALQGL